VASRSADSGGDRNQVPSLRSPVPSVRGEAHRHPATRVFRSHVVLDDCRSRKQTARFQDLFQPPSHAYLTGRANARSARAATSRKSPLVSMATSLSRPISDTSGCLICQRLALAAIFGQLRQNFQEIIRSLSIAACVAAPIVSLPRDASRKRDSTHFRSFAARLPVKSGSHVTIRQTHQRPDAHSLSIRGKSERNSDSNPSSLRCWMSSLFVIVSPVPK
jgi:hypothetical protein